MVDFMRDAEDNEQKDNEDNNYFSESKEDILKSIDIALNTLSKARYWLSGFAASSKDINASNLYVSLGIVENLLRNLKRTIK